MPSDNEASDNMQAETTVIWTVPNLGLCLRVINSGHARHILFGPILLFVSNIVEISSSSSPQLKGTGAA